MHHIFPNPVTSYSTHHDPKGFKSVTNYIPVDGETLSMGGLGEDLLELFPVERPTMRSSAKFNHFSGSSRPTFWSPPESKMDLVATPSVSWAAPHQHFRTPSKRSVIRRRRSRKRTEKQRERENAKRKVKQDIFRARRTECITQERHLRQHVRMWLHAYSSFWGVRLDGSLVRTLPSELQYIMARSDAAMFAYRDFCGQATLSKEINELPTWL